MSRSVRRRSGCFKVFDLLPDSANLVLDPLDFLERFTEFPRVGESAPQLGPFFVQSVQWLSVHCVLSLRDASAPVIRFHLTLYNTPGMDEAVVAKIRLARSTIGKTE